MKRIRGLSKYEALATFIFLAIGIFFRVWGFGNYPFGFDQVQILEASKSILQGDITLIGPRTGPADLFTGPLIYYVTAPLLPFLSMEHVVVAVPTILAVITAVVLSTVLKKDFALREKFLFLSFWAFSPLLVRLDRIFWNPNFMLLAAGLSFFPLVHARKHHFSYKRAALFFVGGFLGYQGHFSGLLLPPLVILLVLVFKKNWRYAVASALGLLVSITPTLIFDLRNNWLNTKGVLALVTRGGSDNSIGSMIGDFLHSGFILIETTGKLVFLDRGVDTVISAGVVVMLLAFTVARKRKQLLVASAWLLGIMVAFSLYPDNKPEYYYTVAIPALVLFFFRLSRKLSQIVLVGSLVVFFVISTQTTLASIKVDGSLSLGSTVFVRDSLYSIAATDGVSKISYDMPYGSDTGYAYVLRDVPLKESGKHVHVSYPNFYTFTSVQQYGGTATWIDPRTNDARHVLTNQAIFSHPTEVTKIERSETPEEVLQSLTFYKDGEEWAKIEVLNQLDCDSGIEQPESQFISFAPQSKTLQLFDNCYLYSGIAEHKSQIGIY